ncbi:hypothetical protein ANO14919_061750 [Xylariales sp. No.14919]|nr:hypothetical protein ANO14919_061750 [Xylariales sp. No.14919]
MTFVNWNKSMKNVMSYAPLHQGLDDRPDDEAEKSCLRPAGLLLPSTASVLMLLCLVALAISNGILIARETHCGSPQETLPYWGSDEVFLKPFHWVTEFSNENVTETSPLWKSLFPIGDGLVTLPDEWSAAQRLPASMKRYKNSNDSIYFVAAYHQLHCLAIIRSVVYHLKDGVKPGVPFMHVTHCLDSLRQSAMCHADDTLLYTEDSHTYGDGQPRMCRDWNALERWTKEHRIYVEGMEDL